MNLNAKNNYEIRGNEITVELTQGQSMVTDNSPAARWLLTNYKWYSSKCRNEFYVCSMKPKNQNYFGNYQKQKKIYFHREYTCINGADHLDRDPLNNRMSNLREASRSLQGFNRNIPSHNTSGIRGIREQITEFERPDGTIRLYQVWRSEIRKNRKSYSRSFQYENDEHRDEAFKQAWLWRHQKEMELFGEHP